MKYNYYLFINFVPGVETLGNNLGSIREGILDRKLLFFIKFKKLIKINKKFLIQNLYTYFINIIIWKNNIYYIYK